MRLHSRFCRSLGAHATSCLALIGLPPRPAGSPSSATPSAARGARATRTRLARFAGAGCALLVMSLPAPALVVDTFWDAAADDWDNDASWSLGVEPTASDNAFINNGGTALVGLAGGVANDLRVGDTLTGMLGVAAGGQLTTSLGPRLQGRRLMPRANPSPRSVVPVFRRARQRIYPSDST